MHRRDMKVGDTVDAERVCKSKAEISEFREKRIRKGKNHEDYLSGMYASLYAVSRSDRTLRSQKKHGR